MSSGFAGGVGGLRSKPIAAKCPSKTVTTALAFMLRSAADVATIRAVPKPYATTQPSESTATIRESVDDQSTFRFVTFASAATDALNIAQVLRAILIESGFTRTARTRPE